MPMHLSRHQRQHVMRVLFGKDVAANQDREPGLQMTRDFDKREG